MIGKILTVRNRAFKKPCARCGKLFRRNGSRVCKLCDKCWLEVKRINGKKGK